MYTHGPVLRRNVPPLAVQAGGTDRAQLALLADERRTLDLLLETVQQMQGGGGATEPQEAGQE